ncbi:MAG: hypothetical protein LQ350_004763 [Teloschistes chrysophthalmus]|nr:MAG: hypothetical protein LQ350_004763 [Niorma chrysophthalma]
MERPTKDATPRYHVNEVSSFAQNPRTSWTSSSRTTQMNQTSELYKSQIAHWNDDRVPELLAASAVLILATFVALTARFWAQRRIGKQWEADNILIVLAAVLAVGVTVACIGAFQNGAGKHSIRVLSEDSDKPQQMVRILKAGYVISIVQGPCLGLIKISILLFYRRIFTMLRRLFQITFYILGLNADIMIWTAIECCVGIICASLPAMAPLLKRAPASTTRSSTVRTSLQSRQLKFPWQRCILDSHPDVHRMCDLEGVRGQDEDVVRARVLQFSDKITSTGGFDRFGSTSSAGIVQADGHDKEVLFLPHGVGDPWSVQPPPERTLSAPPQSRRS